MLGLSISQGIWQPSSGSTPIPGVTYDQYWANVVLLLGFNGANGSTTFTDESPYAHVMTPAGDAQISTTKTLFTQSTYKGDGTGDWLTTPDAAEWTLGSGDFTIEGFVYFNAANSNRGILGIYDGTSGAGSSWGLYIDSSNTINWLAYGTSGGLTTAAQTIAASTWYYFCMERSSTTLRAYFGAPGGTAAVAGSTAQTGSYNDATSALRIGGVSNLYTSLDGYLKEVRVSKGIARYNNSSGFTAPSLVFPRGGVPVFTVNPSISGNGWVGQTLTLSPGTDNGTSRSYQWKQDGVAIGGATATTYVVLAGDVGHTITCTVTATNTNGSASATASAGVMTATDPLAAIRGSRLLYVNSASSGVLTLPTGSVAGDFMVLYCGHGYGVSTPSGWTSRSSLTGANYNGAVFTKVLASGDISTGSVTVSFAGSYFGTIIGVTFVGGTSGYRDIGASQTGSGAASRTVTSGSSPQAGDYLLLFGSARVNAAVTSSSLTSALQSNTASESSAVARFGTAVSGGAQAGTINYAGAPSGDYQAIVAIAP